MGYRVRIDKQSCQSSGNCVNALPEAFGLDADDLGDALPGAAQQPLEKLLAVAKHCPALAISVCDDAGNEIEPG